MFLAEFDGPEGAYVQAVVSLPAAARAGDQATFDSWGHEFERRVVTIADLPHVGCAWRVSVTAEGEVSRLLSILVRDRDGPLLRRLMAGFAFLERHLEESVLFPYDADTFDRFLA